MKYAVSRFVDTFVTYKILSELVRDWEEYPAYKLGLIDKKGNVLKKTWQVRTAEEQAALSPLYRLIFKIKKVFNLVPAQARKIASYGAALLLLKEEYNLSDNDISLIEEFIEKQIDLNESMSASNMSSSGSVAGLDNNPPGPASFAGQRVFDVDSDVFRRYVFPKFHKKRWKNYLNMEEDYAQLGDDIHQYAKDNPQKGIIIRDKYIGVMRYLRMPKNVS